MAMRKVRRSYQQGRCSALPCLEVPTFTVSNLEPLRARRTPRNAEAQGLTVRLERSHRALRGRLWEGYRITNPRRALWRACHPVAFPQPGRRPSAGVRPLELASGVSSAVSAHLSDLVC